MGDAFSIREALQGQLHDYDGLAAFSCTRTENLVRDLVSELAAYREEDIPLFPNVFILSQIDQLKDFAPGSAKHKIGCLQMAGEVAATILKNAAGLAADGWAIYIAKSDDTNFEYGLFRSERHSLATSAEESMQDSGDGQSVILIRNRGHLTVELLSAQGKSFTVSFTSSHASPSLLSTHVALLAAAISEDIESALSTRFLPYLRRLLTTRLQRCHGTLVAVIAADTTDVPENLRDGVWIEPGVALAECFGRASTADSAEALAELQSAESLIAGMFNTDGIVVFSSDGCVRGFRVFVSPTSDEKELIPDKGGGRRRTYALLASRVDSGQLRAALFRSQDGHTECKRAEHG